jgi:hypothetical protein
MKIFITTEFSHLNPQLNNFHLVKQRLLVSLKALER